MPKYLNKSMRRKQFEELRPGLISNAKGEVLEIGFGSGLNMPYYKNVTKLYALEPSDLLFAERDLKVAPETFPVIHLSASAETIPLMDNSIDTVVSTWTLCSIPNVEIALREIYRVLKPAGKFLFIEHGKSPKKFISFLQDVFTPLSKCIAGGCHTNRQIDKLIVDAGFTIVQVERFQQKGKPFLFMYKGNASK